MEFEPIDTARRSLQDYTIYDDLQDRIEALLEKQEDRLENDLDRFSIGAPGPNEKSLFSQESAPHPLTQS